MNEESMNTLIPLGFVAIAVLIIVGIVIYNKYWYLSSHSALTCKKCGKQYSLLTAQIGKGLCNECIAQIESEEAQLSFHCHISDKPISGFEQIQVGLTTMGAFRLLFRPARVRIENDVLQLMATPETGPEVELIRLSLSAIDRITVFPIDVRQQKKVAIAKILSVGGAVGTVLSIAIIAGVNKSPEKIILAVVFGLIGGMVIAALFSLPAIASSVSENLKEMVFHTTDQQALSIALYPHEQDIAIKRLEGIGLQTRIRHSTQ
jgi:hypothetical protein